MDAADDDGNVDIRFVVDNTGKEKASAIIHKGVAVCEHVASPMHAKSFKIVEQQEISKHLVSQTMDGRNDMMTLLTT